MSGEQVTNPNYQNKKNTDFNKSKKVNINILLNRIRADEKKEKIESNVFFGLVAVAVIVTGFIISL